MKLQLPDERHGTRRSVDDLACIALGVDRDGRIRREQAPVAGDRGQQVVQVVRDRAERGWVVRLTDCEELCHVECFGRTRPAL